MNSMTQRARHLVTFALIGILCFQVPAQLFAQVGQSSMSQPQGVGNGVVNRGLGALGSLNDAGPGFFYYGINGAGRGLGYFGSYMTLGGFIPYAQDDLGGFWSADLRSHLSTNGGFFSNVGVVRKQLTNNGSLIGFGLYWDYDGDMNQYAGTGDATYGQFGHMYQQIGVSGEILTDRGAIRSNGYVPVGTTAYNVGAPGDPFTQHHILCAYGLDAALGGADLEVGAWIPKLEAFGGMISVGGYTFGNLNEWSQGTETGERVVPFFGGVYTRFDITVANNWDINLQYNNDPFFDSTGFARLTYRMGGSRRRNVPDQLEQPMMRNEHIVRGHQTPLVCGNRANGQAWKVIHVDNTAAAGGTGTAEAPFTNLADATTAATREWDIVYVHEGNSQLALANAYGDQFKFRNANQFLVGSGGPLTLEVGPKCGTFVNNDPNRPGGAYLFTIPAQSINNPLLSRPGGTSINTDGQGGITIANIESQGSTAALLVQNGNLNGFYQYRGTTANQFGTNYVSAGVGGSSVRLSSFSGSGAATQAGIRITNSSGRMEFTDTTVADMSSTGLLIDQNRGNALNVSYDGIIRSDTGNTGGIVSPLVVIDGNTPTEPSTFNIAVSSPPAGSITANELIDVRGEGIIISRNNENVTNNLGNISLRNNAEQGILVFNDASTTRIRSDAGSGIVRDNTITGGAAILVNDDGLPIVAPNPTPAPVFSYFGTINNAATGSYLLNVNGSNEETVAGVSRGSITLDGPGTTPFQDTGNGVYLQSVDATVSVAGAALASTGQNGILINGGVGTYTFNNTTITGGTTASVLITDRATIGAETNFSNLTINNLSNTTAFGLSASGGGTITIGGISNITTASPTLSAIQTYVPTSTNNTTLNFLLQTVTSANDTTAFAPGPPAVFQALYFESSSSTGTINIESAFTINAGGATTPGTAANIGNAAGGPIVKVGAAVLSP